MKRTGRNPISRTWKAATLFAGQAILLATGGSCLPDNVFAETAGDIVNGLIIAGLNLALTGSGVQI